MSTISPMTPRPQPAAPGEQPVVSLQQRVADRLAQAPPDGQVGGRKKKERAGEEALALHAAGAHTIRNQTQDPAALRLSGAASTARPVRDLAQNTAESRSGDAVAMPYTAPDRAQDTAALRRGGATVVANTVRDQAGDRAASQRVGAAAMDPERGQPDSSSGIAQEAGAIRASADVAGQVTMIESHGIESQVAPPVAIDESAYVEASPSTRADTTELPTTGVVSPVRSDAATTTTTTTAPATEAAQLAPRWTSATPAPAAPAPTPSGKEGSSVTVAFQSWGPGHEVRAQWLPGGGVLVPGSERVGQALSAAASQADAAIAGDGWRVERTDADAEQRERPRGDAEQDA